MVTSINFSVISETTGEIYKLTAEPTEKGLRFICTCPAGAMGSFCKHRAAIISGLYQHDINQDKNNIEIFKGWLVNSRVKALMDSMAIAEENIKFSKKHLIMLKQELGLRLQEGTA